ncbi:hypothetical protein QO259_14775 [Salinicola sp. JS01]|uniref:hypothetical protein n=1 Tax=Salinicola sp. JS01 TaxID=3050071 RepID=UPI00255C1B61|nr:hypothetical protein [Salinicola sp. JS01]WIX32060.1 hypothetical protein QO259_14775 [Salinicola sp. JS01]
MIADPQRLQYLEAMGIPAWVSRYRLINARPTAQSEWEVPAAAEKPAPGQRLHALLETPAAQSTERTPAAMRPDSAAEPAAQRASRAPVARARALLGEDPAPAETSAAVFDKSVDKPVDTPTDTPAETPAPEAATRERAAPLRFSLTLAVLDQRWWLLLPGGREGLPAPAQALLKQMLVAAGLPGDWRALASLDWPLMETPVDDPLGEARDGLAVFCGGQAMRNGLSIEGAIVIPGADAAALFAGDTPFEFDCHRWPHPASLLGDPAAKRASWPQLHATGEAWRRAAAGAA